MTSSAPILVADIGGTNARFALTRAGDARVKPPLEAVQKLATEDHPSLLEAARTYLRGLGGERPQRAVFAVASAVTTDQIKFTNSPWSFSIAELSRELGLTLSVINDFTAMARVLPVLEAADLDVVGGVAPDPKVQKPRRSFAVLGPGTGLGVGGVIVEGSGATVIQSEGGHVGFAPGNEAEIELLRVLAKRYGRISAERLVAGPGLVNLHDALREIDGLPPREITPEQITQAAQDGSDEVCNRVVRRFTELLGAFAGDVALAFGAWDGVFLSGGVAQKLQPFIERGDFRRRFEDKGRHAALLKAIPTQLITHALPGLLGSAVQARLDAA